MFECVLRRSSIDIDGDRRIIDPVVTLIFPSPPLNTQPHIAMSMTKFQISARMLKTGLNLYPPLFGAGIRVKEIRDDFRYAKVSMPLTIFNRNYVNTHFGGSLFAMTDPFYMLLLLNIFQGTHVIWDKGASIDFKRPGKGTVTAEFFIEDDLIETIRQMEPNEVKIIDLPVDVKDENGEVVARVVKTEYVRRKGTPDELVDEREAS